MAVFTKSTLKSCYKEYHIYPRYILNP